MKISRPFDHVFAIIFKFNALNVKSMLIDLNFLMILSKMLAIKISLSIFLHSFRVFFLFDPSSIQHASCFFDWFLKILLYKVVVLRRL